MSFDLLETYRLERVGGAVLAKYRRLVAAADAAMHGSPAHVQLGRFMKSWEQDADRVTREAEQEAKAEAKARV
jgi:hypothetical protein